MKKNISFCDLCIYFLTNSFTSHCTKYTKFNNLSYKKNNEKIAMNKLSLLKLFVLIGFRNPCTSICVSFTRNASIVVIYCVVIQGPAWRVQQCNRCQVQITSAGWTHWLLLYSLLETFRGWQDGVKMKDSFCWMCLGGWSENKGYFSVKIKWNPNKQLKMSPLSYQICR